MPEDVVTNIRVGKPSRKKLRAGDLFTVQMGDELFLFGRVVSTEALPGSAMGTANLIYIYKPLFSSPQVPDPSMLSPDELLVPPAMINRLPWSRGYFETVASWPLKPGEVLESHAFRSGSGRYFDEALNEVPIPDEPVGNYGMQSYRSIDDVISLALGIDQAPE